MYVKIDIFLFQFYVFINPYFMSSRRVFLRGSALSVTGILAASMPSNSTMLKKKQELPDNLRILMQGDSITDAGRNRGRYYPNVADGMGRGYVYQIVSTLLGKYPEKKLQFYNRGISGNKVFQLRDRWEDDCIQLKPDVLSILIGVNDFWHSLRDYDGTVEVYEKDLRSLLSQTLEILPEVKLILGEPFAVEGGTAINDQWYPDFSKYRDAARKIASDFNAHLIPYQKIFDEALNVASVSYWCPDGVHPSMAGAYLMKEAWIKTFDELYS